LYNKETKKPVTNTCLLGLVNQTDTSCRYTKTLLTTQINYVEPNIIVTWNLSKTILNQNCIKNEIVIEGNNMIKIHNCSIAINDLSISNYNSDYTQSIYTRNNVTKLDPISYIQAKEIFFEQNKENQIYKIIVIVTLGLLILSISLYLLYKFKEIPKRILIKYNNTKGDDPTIDSQELQEIPKLYPKIT